MADLFFSFGKFLPLGNEEMQSESYKGSFWEKWLKVVTFKK
jgi:hypothetical protein